MHRQEWFRLLANGNDHRWVKILHQTNQEYLKTGRCHIHQGLYYQYCSFRATGLQLLVGYVCASSLQISFSLSLLIMHTHRKNANCRSGYARQLTQGFSAPRWPPSSIDRLVERLATTTRYLVCLILVCFALLLQVLRLILTHCFLGRNFSVFRTVFPSPQPFPLVLFLSLLNSFGPLRTSRV